MQQKYYFGRGWAKSLPYIGMIPGLLLFFLFSLGPSLATALFSFTDISGVPNTEWNFVGLANYQEFFRYFVLPNSELPQIMLRTLIYCAATTLIQSALALLIALILNARLRGHLFFRSLVFLPTVLGVTVVGLIWSLVLNPVDGPVDQFLNMFGQRSDLLTSSTQAFPLVIGIQIWMSIGTSVIIFLAGLQTIPQELNEAAKIDGASPWGVFRAVTFPLIAPSLTVNILYAVIGSLQSFQLVYVLTRGELNTSVLSYEIYKQGFGDALRQGYASMLSIVQFLLVLLIAFLFQLYLRRREVQL